jgi:magnesium-transporting ATPase (P-type)
LSAREASRRLLHVGPNVLPPPPRSRWLRDLGEQLIHPLALVLWGAAALAWASGTHVIAGAVVAVIVINALFAFVQELQAQRAAEALGSLLPASATVVRDGLVCRVAAADLVPGDVLVVEEGARISADARLVAGEVELDMSPVTGESMPVSRSADPPAAATTSWMSQPNLVLSGTLCTSGEARGVVFATGAHTELGRIAALSRRLTRDRSPLENQVRTVAWLIAGVGVAVGALFMPLGLLAGLSAHDSFLFAVGLLVANVPEGLLPTITLALAVGVRSLAGRGAVVKRLSAVETLGSTTVICTDKTGTLTQNRMAAVRLWTPVAGDLEPGAACAGGLVAAIAACSTVSETSEALGAADATELALFALAHGAPAPGAGGTRERYDGRRAVFRFTPQRRRMSVVQEGRHGVVVYAKGAVEAILPRCAGIASGDESEPMSPALSAAAQQAAGSSAGIRAPRRRRRRHCATATSRPPPRPSSASSRANSAPRGPRVVRPRDFATSVSSATGCCSSASCSKCCSLSS